VYQPLSAQLSLPIQLPDDETFASFYPGENTQLITALKNAAVGQGDPFIYLWGQRGVGRSHLLHATSAECSGQDVAAAYVPLERSGIMSPAMLEGMEHLQLVCIDNLDAVAGCDEWELALFNFYNRWLEQGHLGSLIVCGSRPPRRLGLVLPDLVSRLEWGVSYQILPLDDEGKLSALQLRAELRGFKLPVDVGRFLLNRLSRDMRTLLATLNRLDKASIAAQRKLTIPFVKEILSM